MSEKRSKQKRGSSQKESAKRSKKAKKIRLLFRGGRRSVPLNELSALSNVIALLVKNGESFSSVDLKIFSPSAVHYVADLIEQGFISGEMSFLMLSESLKIAHKLEMPKVRRLLEEVLLEQAKSSYSFLLESILVAADAPLRDETDAALRSMAAKAFMHLARMPQFHRIPTTQFLILISSCQLAVTDELQVIDAVLAWLRRQLYPNQIALIVFSEVRTRSITAYGYAMVMQRLTDLNFPDKIQRGISRILTSTHAARVCSHRNPGPRCQKASPAAACRMDLSYPAFEDGCKLTTPVKKFIGMCDKWQKKK